VTLTNASSMSLPPPSPSNTPLWLDLWGFHRLIRVYADSPIRQNNALLNSLSTKVSALRSVTIDIHDNARDQDTLDHTVRLARCLTRPTTYKDACGGFANYS
jgi:hypothetical protein